MIFLLLILGLFLLDVKIKDHIESRPADSFPQRFWKGRITICRTHNRGMMMNLLENKPGLVTILSGTAGLLALLYYIPAFFKKGNHLFKLSGALILGGAASNIFDHLRNGYVVDYFKINIKRIQHIVFNLADIFIFIGCIITVIVTLLKRK